MADWMALVLTDVQLYALMFLLGSIFVATLSDLRYNSAQKEFPEVWLLIVFVVAIYDFYSAVVSEDWQFLGIKWGLIVLFVILSNSAIGIYFKLAWADVAACAAAACLLPPLLIIVFFLLLKPLSLIMKPFLMGFKKKDFYPFIPVVLAGLLGTMAIALWGVGWVGEAGIFILSL